MRSVILLCALVAQSVPYQPTLSASRMRIPAHESPELVGRLPNGITTYVRQNQQVQGRVELRLVVRAGSANEADDQRGAAYLVARIALQRAPDSLRTYFSSESVDATVHTSTTATVYRINVDTDSANLTQALALLVAWARWDSVTQEALENGRSVAVSTLLGAEEHTDVMTAFVDSIRFAGAPDAMRHPLGTDVALNARTPTQLDQFVHAWYRPDNMAVVLVGDIHPQQAAQMVAAQFNAISAPTTPLHELPVIPSSGLPTGVAVALLEDSASPSLVHVLYRLQAQRGAPDIGAQAGIFDPAYGQLLNQRLGTAVARGSAHMAWATTTIRLGQPEGAVADYQIQVSEGDSKGTVDSVVAAVVAEVARAGKYGFTPAEVALAAQLLSSPNQQVAQYIQSFANIGLHQGHLDMPTGLGEMTSKALHTRATQWAHATPLIMVGLSRGHSTRDVAPAALQQIVTTVSQRRLGQLSIDTSLAIVPLTRSPGTTLAAMLQREVAKAVRVGRTPVVELGATWCGPCHQLDDLLHQPRMRGMIQPMYIIQVDVDVWSASLSATGLSHDNGKGIPTIVALNRGSQGTKTSQSGFDEDNLSLLDIKSTADWQTGLATEVLPDIAEFFAACRLEFQKH